MKHQKVKIDGINVLSHPLRVRGLKLIILVVVLSMLWSHPLRVRGLKLSVAMNCFKIKWSHPLRVRGLKLIKKRIMKKKKFVAPFTGAWIETLELTEKEIIDRSHPLRVRGLKQGTPCFDGAAKGRSHPLRVRGLKLSRLFSGDYTQYVAPFTGAWIETECLSICVT